MFLASLDKAISVLEILSLIPLSSGLCGWFHCCYLSRLFPKSFNLLGVHLIKIYILISTQLTNQQPIKVFLSKIIFKINLIISGVVCWYPVCVYQRVGSVQTEVCIRRQSTTGWPGRPTIQYKLCTSAYCVWTQFLVIRNYVVVTMPTHNSWKRVWSIA